MTGKEFLKSIPALDKISVIFAQTTRMPMVFCHEETADDYVYIYVEEEAAKAQVQMYQEQKRPAFIVNCKQKELLPFLGELRLLGVNAICVAESGASGREGTLIQLTEILKYPDYSSLSAEKRPVENPTLQLSMLYFMQELRRPADANDKRNLAELEEETGINIVRGKYLLPVREPLEGEDANKRGVLLIKNEKEETFIPLFTDGVQLRRFVKEQKCPVMVCSFFMIADMLQRGNASGIIINPATSGVALGKPGVAALTKRFCEEKES